MVGRKKPFSFLQKNISSYQIWECSLAAAFCCYKYWGSLWLCVKQVDLLGGQWDCFVWTARRVTRVAGGQQEGRQLSPDSLISNITSGSGGRLCIFGFNYQAPPLLPAAPAPEWHLCRATQKVTRFDCWATAAYSCYGYSLMNDGPFSSGFRFRYGVRGVVQGGKVWLIHKAPCAVCRGPTHNPIH